MAETVRLNKVLRELNISIDRAVDFLESKGIDVEKSPNTKISEEVHVILSNEFQTDANKKVASQEVSEAKQKEKEILREQREREIEEKQKAEAKREEIIRASTVISRPKSVGKIDLEPKKKEEAPAAKVEEVKEVVQELPKKEDQVTAKTETIEEPKAAAPVEKKVELKPAEQKLEKLNSDGELVPDEKVATQYQKLSGPKISGNKIDLSQFNKPKKKKEDKKPESKPGDNAANKKKRRRISKVGGPQPGSDQNKTAGPNRGGGDRFKGGKQAPRRPIVKEEPSEEDVQKQVRETLEKLQGKSSKGKGAKYRREKRELHREQSEKSLEQEAADSRSRKKKTSASKANHYIKSIATIAEGLLNPADITTVVAPTTVVTTTTLARRTAAQLVAEKINTLNALFQNTGTSSGSIPSITSSLAITLTQGETLNYELTANYGVGYEWDLSNVSGVSTVEGNVRKLIGGSSLEVGTYNIPVKAINYNGEDSETVVLTVSTPTLWPATRGRKRFFAHRPLPSIMTAI